MPKRTDIKKILLIGSGPVVIGQSGEFDYAAFQVCGALKEEGYEVVVVNSNPITVSTDSTVADAIYIQPLTVENLEKIIAVERPDGLLPLYGGQTALNMSYFLAQLGVLNRYQIKLLGIEAATIESTEDRSKFREFAAAIGLKLPNGAVAANISEGVAIGQRIGFPVVVRASFALEGAGVMTAYNQEELEEFIETGLNSSPIRQVLIEESLYGWREFEFEVIRDLDDKCMIVSSLESIDSVGVHTGDSAVVLPAQGLSAAEYSSLTEICKKVVKNLGVLGGVNLQFAQNPVNGDITIIEVNPRFTGSSALAAKATGFQIPGVTAKLAVGLSLDEVGEQKPEALFQPAIDYTAVKLPRFSFEKFPEADQVLGTSMKSVGAVTAFGRNFKEAFQKALRALMINRYGLGADGRDPDESRLTIPEIKEKITNPNAERWFYIRHALKLGMTIQELAVFSKLSKWFINELAELVAFEKKLSTYALYNLTADVLVQAKQMGFSDIQLAYLLRTTEDEVRITRLKKEINIHYVAINPSGITSKSEHPYYFSTYHPEPSIEVKKTPKVLIVGSGANRIGQGMEYDYCVVHAARAAANMDYQSIIINCNPTAVSTDPFVAGTLYFEPLAKEDILNVISHEEPTAVILQFGGRSSLNLMAPLQKSGIKILGTTQDSYERSTNWNRLKEMLRKLSMPFPGNGTAADIKEALETAGQIGYPVIIRQSYSLDKPVEISYDSGDLRGYVERLKGISQTNPLLIEKFLDDAIGIVVDCMFDGKDLIVCGIMEQIEEAGISPADCACALPPYSIGEAVISKIKADTRLLAEELQIKGFLSVQYAIKHDSVCLVEVNPQAGLMVPFISKATGVDWVAAATRIMLGDSIQEQGLKETSPKHTAIKEAVFSFDRFPGVDTLLGPEARSSGTVMGIDDNFGLAFIKAQLAAGEKIPTAGTIFMSIRDEDKRVFTTIARQLIDMGFAITAFEETATVLNRNNLPCQSVYRVGEGRPNITDKIKNEEIQWIINISSGRKIRQDEVLIRRTAVQRGIPMITTISGTQVAVIGLEQYLRNEIAVNQLAEYYQR